MPIYNYDILGIQPGNPKSKNEYSGVVLAETPKAALLAALDDQFGDKDDGDTPYERLTRSWANPSEIDDCWGSLAEDDNSFVLLGDNEFHVSVELAVMEQGPKTAIARGIAESQGIPITEIRLSDDAIINEATKHAPDDIDSVRPSDRFAD